MPKKASRPGVPGRRATWTDPQDGKRYLGIGAAADYLGVHRVTLDRYRRRFPTELRGYKVGAANQVFYKVDDLTAFRGKYLTPQRDPEIESALSEFNERYPIK